MAARDNKESDSARRLSALKDLKRHNVDSSVVSLLPDYVLNPEKLTSAQIKSVEDARDVSDEIRHQLRSIEKNKRVLQGAHVSLSDV